MCMRVCMCVLVWVCVNIYVTLCLCLSLSLCVLLSLVHPLLERRCCSQTKLRITHLDWKSREASCCEHKSCLKLESVYLQQGLQSLKNVMVRAQSLSETESVHLHGHVSWRLTTVMWWQSSQSNRHSTIGTWQTEYHEALPSSAKTCSHTSFRRSPTMVMLHDTRFVQCRKWNDGWTVKTIVTWRSSASMILAQVFKVSSKDFKVKKTKTTHTHTHTHTQNQTKSVTLWALSLSDSGWVHLQQDF